MAKIECQACAANAARGLRCPVCAANRSILFDLLPTYPNAPSDRRTRNMAARDEDDDDGKFTDNPKSGARKKPRDEDDGDDAPSTKGKSGGKPKKGMNVGMIVLIVGVLLTCCICVPGSIGVGFFFVGLDKVGSAAKRTETINNVRQIGIAMHGHHDMTRALPTPKTPQGDLSWRVTILPMIEQNNLFGQFDKNGGWDRPPNQAFLNQRPKTYDSPLHPRGDMQQTNFQYFTGPNTTFPNNLQKVTFGNFTDGTSNTALFGEAQQAVPWSKPADMVVTPTGRVPTETGIFIVGMADGTARVVDTTKTSDQVIRNLINPRDGALLPGRLD